jgi:adenylosuccinate synthase
MKGTGAAVIERINRDPRNNNTAGMVVDLDYLDYFAQKYGITVAVDGTLYAETMDSAKVMQIEGAQGFSLSIYHGFYPYTTSRDVTPAQVLADCAIPYRIRPVVVGTLRTLPIRVSNRKEGTSGPGYFDQKELDWEKDLGMQPELTTVTKLPRRIFTFSNAQTREAIRQCSPEQIFLNFCNYVSPEEVDRICRVVSDAGSTVTMVGVGPRHQDVMRKVHYDHIRGGNQ